MLGPGKSNVVTGCDGLLRVGIRGSLKDSCSCPPSERSKLAASMFIRLAAVVRMLFLFSCIGWKPTKTFQTALHHFSVHSHKHSYSSGSENPAGYHLLIRGNHAGMFAGPSNLKWKLKQLLTLFHVKGRSITLWHIKIRACELQVSSFLICLVCCGDKTICICLIYLAYWLECIENIGTSPCEEPVETRELVLSRGRTDNL